MKPDHAANEAEMAAELIAWCGSALAKFKVPRDVRFVAGFPLTASGKVQKFKLRDEHQKMLPQKADVQRLKSEV